MTERITGEGPNPSGLCMCGCGRPTPIAREGSTRRGNVKGEPIRFAPGHHTRRQNPGARMAGDGPNPSGLCLCGCGRRTNLAQQSNSKIGDIIGAPQRFCAGHRAGVSQVDYIVDPATGCWVWQRSIAANGYGRLNVEGSFKMAHRVYYERLVGPIARGLDLDHLCRNRACVNPAHLEPVTRQENLRRGAGHGGALAGA